MNHALASGGITKQFTPLTTFLHTVPALIAYLVAVGLFLLLAKSERLGGLQFRHVIFALFYGVLGAIIVMPASWQASISKLANPGERLTLDMVLGAIIIVEIIMIVRDRRKGGAVIE